MGYGVAGQGMAGLGTLSRGWARVIEGGEIESEYRVFHRMAGDRRDAPRPGRARRRPERRGVDGVRRDVLRSRVGRAVSTGWRAGW